MKKKTPLVTVITVVKNAEKDLQKTINSVKSQSYPKIEYIVIDGKSVDGTIGIIKKNKMNISKYLKKKDKKLYEAINTGIKFSNGEIISLIHAGDFYFDKNSIKESVNHLIKKKCSFIFANQLIVERDKKVYRFLKPKNFKPNFLKFGIQPPHPTLFIWKNANSLVNGYSTKYKLEGDFDYFCKLFKYKLAWSHLDKITVNQIRGGLSDTNYFDKIKSAKNIKKILKTNRIKTNYLFFILKFLTRMKERLFAKYM